MSLTLPRKAVRGPLCWYQTINLDDEDRAKLDAWLLDPTVTGSRISVALSAYGIKQQSVTRHRGSWDQETRTWGPAECACPR